MAGLEFDRDAVGVSAKRDRIDADSFASIGTRFTSLSRGFQLAADVPGAVGEGSARLRNAIANTQVASHYGGDVPGWMGRAVDACTDSILRLGEHARALAESFAPTSAAIADWADALGVAISSTVPALWERYNEVSAVYARTCRP